jgi:two-component system, chemotaxis family, chemotaxis protein CheY
VKEVLVVDDSPVVRKIARRMLESMRLSTQEACDGQQALAVCAFQMPDAIFVDAHMPVLDGVEFVRELRRMTGGDRPWIIYCTSEHDVPHIARALHAGADDYMMKPFDREHMQAKFQSLVAA